MVHLILVKWGGFVTNLLLMLMFVEGVQDQQHVDFEWREYKY